MMIDQITNKPSQHFPGLPLLWDSSQSYIASTSVQNPPHHLPQPRDTPVHVSEIPKLTFSFSTNKNIINSKIHIFVVDSHAKAPTKPYGAPVEFLHSITNSWTVGGIEYYRHKVIIKNTSEKPITDLKLVIENLSGSLWGLTPTLTKNVYELPQWSKVIKPSSECSFVYVQGGPQAKVSIQSYH